MILGILRETKQGESRVICTPQEVAAITAAGHTVYAQRGCGARAGFPDEAYEAAGALLASTAQELFAVCDMVAKVKEFTPEEWPLIRKGQLLLGCLHPAANPAEVDALLESGCIAFTAEDSHRYGSPNSEAAGKMGALFGLESLLTIHGGKGKYVGGFAGAPGIEVLILGSGKVGRSALQVLHALGANCTVMARNMQKLRELSAQYHGRVRVMHCSQESIAEVIPKTDLVLNCVKWQKENPDFLITRAMLSRMEKGSVIVDISNDEPGAIETSHATTHDQPRYIVDGIVHYCVSNIPGAVAHSASVAYAAQMLPMLLSLLNDGEEESCIRDGCYRRALTVYRGLLTHEETSAVQGKPWLRPEEALGISGYRLDPAPPATDTRSAYFYSWAENCGAQCDCIS